MHAKRASYWRRSGNGKKKMEWVEKHPEREKKKSRREGGRESVV